MSRQHVAPLISGANTSIRTCPAERATNRLLWGRSTANEEMLRRLASGVQPPNAAGPRAPCAPANLEPQASICVADRAVAVFRSSRLMRDDSPMNGAPLTAEKMGYLVSELFKTAQPALCPHGRPIVVKVPRAQLDKGLRRAPASN